MSFAVTSILRPGPSTWQCFRAVSYVPRKKTYYQVLGIEPSATIDEIKHAFVSETRKLHPDSAKDICPAINRTEQLMALKEAYDFLRKPEQKAEYDRELEFSRKVSREMFYENRAKIDRPMASPHP
uniref:J domain-containing protein n=1 Tax=Panagrellus redivivus TaxID=6233 RepID=A0A7E4UUX7_PANRE